jgi:hypothetical protein
MSKKRAELSKTIMEINDLRDFARIGLLSLNILAMALRGFVSFDAFSRSFFNFS